MFQLNNLVILAIDDGNLEMINSIKSQWDSTLNSNLYKILHTGGAN